MMLHLQRSKIFPHCTIGRLSIDGVFFCHTLEDTVRPAGVKIPGRTAIPAGQYEVLLTHSVRFKKILPLLLKVPGFEGVRIHGGNTADDTLGCILVGFAVNLSSQKIYRSASDRLIARLKHSSSSIQITITNGMEVK